jgi:hypothetical protein
MSAHLAVCLCGVSHYGIGRRAGWVGAQGGWLARREGGWRPGGRYPGQWRKAERVMSGAEGVAQAPTYRRVCVLFLTLG